MDTKIHIYRNESGRWMVEWTRGKLTHRLSFPHHDEALEFAIRQRDRMAEKEKHAEACS